MYTGDRVTRVSTEVTFCRGDLSVCPSEAFAGAHEWFISKRKSVPQGSPQGQTLRALLLCIYIYRERERCMCVYVYIYIYIYIHMYVYRGTSVLH